MEPEFIQRGGTPQVHTLDTAVAAGTDPQILFLSIVVHPVQFIFLPECTEIDSVDVFTPEVVHYECFVVTHRHPDVRVVTRWQHVIHLVGVVGEGVDGFDHGCSVELVRGQVEHLHRVRVGREYFLGEFGHIHPPPFGVRAVQHCRFLFVSHVAGACFVIVGPVEYVHIVLLA